MVKTLSRHKDKSRLLRRGVRRALIQVDRSSPVPLYFQVAQRLQELIESGQLAPGSRLENEVTLADQLGLSRPTMRQAIQYLVDKGMLVRKRGVGTQVVHARVRRTVELTSLYDDLDRTHQRPRTDVLSLAERGRGRVAVAMALPAGSTVLAIDDCATRRASPSP